MDLRFDRLNHPGPFPSGYTPLSREKRNGVLILLRKWFCLFAVIIGLTVCTLPADSQQVSLVTWPTKHAAPPATLPGVSSTELAAYRLGLAFTEESNVVDLITSQNDLLGIPAEQAAYFKRLFGERYRLIDADPVFHDAPSALSYCFSAETPTHGYALVYVPKKIDANLPPLVFLHGYGGSFLWTPQLLAENFPDRLIICPAFGISSSLMPAAYLSECLKAVQDKVERPIHAPILIGLSAGGLRSGENICALSPRFQPLDCARVLSAARGDGSL